ncbi:MAG TPA: hypothetical protein VNA25_25965, partial [Phycisphaerae bacterium]|nr:hypothetical protein [Phycisphaerae bacterium]
CTGTRRKRHVAAAALVLAAMAVVTIPRLARAVSPSSDEMATTRRWVAAKFEAVQPLSKPEPGLPVSIPTQPGVAVMTYERVN